MDRIDQLRQNLRNRKGLKARIDTIAEVLDFFLGMYRVDSDSLSEIWRLVIAIDHRQTEEKETKE